MTELEKSMCPRLGATCQTRDRGMAFQMLRGLAGLIGRRQRAQKCQGTPERSQSNQSNDLSAKSKSSRGQKAWSSKSWLELMEAQVSFLADCYTCTRWRSLTGSLLTTSIPRLQSLGAAAALPQINFNLVDSIWRNFHAKALEALKR
jgi:hypothetical protein